MAVINADVGNICGHHRLHPEDVLHLVLTRVAFGMSKSSEIVFQGLMKKLGVGDPKEPKTEAYMEDVFITDPLHILAPNGNAYMTMDVRIRPQFGKRPAVCFQLASYPDLQIMLDAEILEEMVDNLVYMEAVYEDWLQAQEAKKKNGE